MSQMTMEEAHVKMRIYHLRPCENSLMKELIHYSTNPDFSDNFMVDPMTGPVCALFAEEPKDDLSFVEYSFDLATGLNGDTSIVCFCQSHTTGNGENEATAEVLTRYRFYTSKVIIREDINTELVLESPSSEAFFNNHADANKYLANIIVNGICLPRAPDETEKQYQDFIEQRNDIIEIAKKYL